MRIAILTPTILRPAGLIRSLKSLRETTKHLNNIDAIVAAEKDDVKAEQIAAQYNARVVYCKESRQGPAYAWNTALAAALDYDAYFTGSDDIEYFPGWLDEVLRVLETELHGSGLVGINDGRWDREKVERMCATHYLMTRDFIIKHNGGVAAAPFYHADYTDMEANARARRAGCWAWAEKALVRHWWNGPKGDEGYLNATKKRPEMRPLYKEREQQGFPNNFEPILK